ncbi:MAG TPA: LysR family transcriptional regulator [Candidatus Udaeobacter sp.]|jgi:DNA-binding transcriptional LysR family regulator|nr:LysR family transcriptional regulator [Candidatus Udaeobacter sp.]
MLLDRIELFVRVAKHRNLGKTAREIHVSASSVCQRLKSLENDFGTKLYKKKREGIELTGAGETLLTAASEVLNQLGTLKITLNRDSEIAVRTLTIGGTYSPSAKYLPSAIAAFQKTHPDVKVTFVTSDKTSIEKLLRDSQVEIAIIQSPSESADFSMEYFAVDNLMFFAHPTHPLAKKKRLALADLSQTPLIVIDGKDTSETILKHLRCRGVTPNVALRCVSPEAAKAAVRKKMGVGILFYNLIEEEVKRKDLKILKFPDLPKLVGNSYIVYGKNKALSSAGNDFLSVLRSMKARQKNPVSVAEIDAA